MRLFAEGGQTSISRVCDVRCKSIALMQPNINMRLVRTWSVCSFYSVYRDANPTLYRRFPGYYLISSLHDHAYAICLE